MMKATSTSSTENPVLVGRACSARGVARSRRRPFSGTAAHCGRVLSNAGLAQSRIAMRPVSQSTSTSNLRAPDATVIRPPLLPPSGRSGSPRRLAHESFCAVNSLMSILGGSRYSLGSWSTLKRLPGSRAQERLARLGDRLALRESQPGRELPRDARISLVDTGPPYIGMTSRPRCHERQHDDSSSSVTPATAPGGLDRLIPTHDVLVSPSPPSAPSAPSETIRRRRASPGEAYLYSWPHGSFGTDDFFQ